MTIDCVVFRSQPAEQVIWHFHDISPATLVMLFASLEGAVREVGRRNYREVEKCSPV